MGDFFAGLGAGFRFPDTQMNSGPLPSLGQGAPAGAHGDPDGRINFNGSLLGDITPYAYGKGARVGSDRNYQQVPHRIQKIVHQIWVPAAVSPGVKVPVSHVVDQGDVAFVINSNNNGFLLFGGSNISPVDKQRLARHAVFANLATVNYILSGIQRVSWERVEAFQNGDLWALLRKDLGMRTQLEMPTDSIKLKDLKLQLDKSVDWMLRDILQVVRMRMLPFGICAGSEKQGGQTETGLSPVQAGANYVTTMTVDGQNIDLINYWAHESLNAGDQLIFKLEKKTCREYTLNHYYKGVVTQDFGRDKECWQLVPSVFRMGDHYHNNDEYDCRTHGYWRIAQLMQQRSSSCTPAAMYWNNDSNNMRSGGGAQLLQVLFAPVYVNNLEPPGKIIALTWSCELSDVEEAKKRTGIPVNKRINASPAQIDVLLGKINSSKILPFLKTFEKDRLIDETTCEKALIEMKRLSLIEYNLKIATRTLISDPALEAEITAIKKKLLDDVRDAKSTRDKSIAAHLIIFKDEQKKLTFLKKSISKIDYFNNGFDIDIRTTSIFIPLLELEYVAIPYSGCALEIRDNKTLSTLKSTSRIEKNLDSKFDIKQDLSDENIYVYYSLPTLRVLFSMENNEHNYVFKIKSNDGKEWIFSMTKIWTNYERERIFWGGVPMSMNVHEAVLLGAGIASCAGAAPGERFKSVLGLSEAMPGPSAAAAPAPESLAMQVVEAPELSATAPAAKRSRVTLARQQAANTADEKS